MQKQFSKRIVPAETIKTEAAGSIRTTVKEYLIITAAVILMDVGIYVFKFSNNFSFGGVSGIAVLLHRLVPFSTSQINLAINMLLLAVGFAFLGKGFGMKTAYVTVISSLLLNILEAVFPMSGPLTGETTLELAYAIALPAFAAAMFFYVNASGGGTDILAMIIKKYSTFDIGTSLLIIDAVVVGASFLVFDIKTGLYSVCGLLVKTIFINRAMESMKLAKYFTIVTSNPEPICDYIKNTLNRSATIYHAEGAYTHEDRTVILCALNRKQTVILERYIEKVDSRAFIMVTKSSEIFGKGFRLSA